MIEVQTLDQPEVHVPSGISPLSHLVSFGFGQIIPIKTRHKIMKNTTLFKTILILQLFKPYPAASEDYSIVSSKEFTEAFIEFSKCTTITLVLLGVNDSRLKFSDEERREISSANFGLIDTGRLYEVNYKLDGFFSDIFINSYLGYFNNSDKILTKILRENGEKAPKEHLSFLASEVSIESSRALGWYKAGNADMLRDGILDCEKSFKKIISTNFGSVER